MNIRELIEMLEEAAQECGDGAEIQLATQSNYPLRYHLGGVYVPSADDPPRGHEEHTGDWPGCPECEEPAQENVVWLVEGSQHYSDPYGVPADAFVDARRS